MKKYVAIVLLVAIVALFVAGCSPAETQTDDTSKEPATDDTAKAPTTDADELDSELNDITSDDADAEDDLGELI